MMMIFWDKDGVLLTEYLPRGTTINGPCYASIIERLRSVIVEKERGKVIHGVLLLYDNTPHSPAQGCSRLLFNRLGFIESNQSAYSLNIAPADYHPLSNLNKFLRSKNLSSDDEAVTAVEDYLTDS